MAYKINMTPEQIIEARRRGIPDEQILNYMKTGDATKSEIKPGFVQSTLRMIAKPFLRLETTGENIAKATYQLAKRNVAKSEQALNAPADFGYLGNVEPLKATGKGGKLTGKDVKDAAGVSLEIASNFVGGQGVGSLAKTTMKGAVAQGIKTGAKAGLITGLSGGTGRGLQDKEKGVGYAVGQGAIEGAVGTVVGGALGGITAAMSKGLQRLINPNKAQLDDALSVTKPVVNKKQGISAIAQGRGETKGLLNTYDITPSEQDQQVAHSVAGIVKKSNSPIKNIQAINKEISNISDNEVTPFLKANPASHSVNSLKSVINSVKGAKTDLIKSDSSLEKTYDLVIKRANTIIDEYASKQKSGTLTTLDDWTLRKEFDNAIQKQFGDAVYMPEKNTAIKEAVRNVRAAFNDYIAENTPDDIFRARLAQLFDMYQARTNIAENFWSKKLIGSNALSRIIQANKKTITTVGIAGTVYGASRAVKSIVNSNQSNNGGGQ